MQVENGVCKESLFKGERTDSSSNGLGGRNMVFREKALKGNEKRVTGRLGEGGERGKRCVMTKDGDQEWETGRQKGKRELGRRKINKEGGKRLLAPMRNGKEGQYAAQSVNGRANSSLILSQKGTGKQEVREGEG